MLLTQSEANKLYGQTVLMGGNESLHYTAYNVAQMANFAARLGINSISLKVADGAISWHSPQQVAEFRKSANAQGVGFVPFAYSYGNTFGALKSEVQLYKEYMLANGNAGIVIDMEKEWNGHLDYANEFVALMEHDKPGPLVISTWADPAMQDWQGVLNVLAPIVDGWGAMEYNNWLAAQETEFGNRVLLPELDLASDFGPNNLMAIASQAKARNHSVWLWTYTTAITRQALVRDLVKIMNGAPVAIDPTKREYLTLAGDSLFTIARVYYNDGNKWPLIYNANRGIIGLNPDFLPIGIRLVIP